VTGKVDVLDLIWAACEPEETEVRQIGNALCKKGAALKGVNKKVSLRERLSKNLAKTERGLEGGKPEPGRRGLGFSYFRALGGKEVLEGTFIPLVVRRTAPVEWSPAKRNFAGKSQ